MQIEQNHVLEKWDIKGEDYDMRSMISKLESLDNINDVDTEQYCRSDAHNEKKVFDVFASKYDLNDTISNRYCLPSTVSQRRMVYCVIDFNSVDEFTGKNDSSTE